MAELHLLAVQWCAQHGHPVLALRTGDNRFFIVAMTTEDAMALAIMPDAADSGRPPRRLHRLLETTVAALGARLTEVRLHVGRDDVLRASLHLHSPAGALSLPAHFADGVALAHRARAPLRMADEDLRRVPLAPLAGETMEFPMPSPSFPAPPPEAFRAVIEALDLDDFGPRRGAPGSTDGDHQA
jgi:bifunctional DNase/RNase